MQYLNDIRAEWINYLKDEGLTQKLFLKKSCHRLQKSFSRLFTD